MAIEPLTIDQVADRLRASRDSVRYAIEHRGLRASRLPGEDRTPYEVREADVLQFLAKTSQPPRPEMTELPQIPKLYTLGEVAAQTGVPLRWIQDGVRGERLPHVRPGRKPLMTAEDATAVVKAYMARRPADPDVQAELDRRSRGRQAPTRKAA